jgi:hypothetical protein
MMFSTSDDIYKSFGKRFFVVKLFAELRSVCLRVILGPEKLGAGGNRV